MHAAAAAAAAAEQDEVIQVTTESGGENAYLDRTCCETAAVEGSTGFGCTLPTLTKHTAAERMHQQL